MYLTRQIAPSYIETDGGAKSESHAKCVSIAVDMVSARMIADMIRTMNPPKASNAPKTSKGYLISPDLYSEHHGCLIVHCQ